MNRIVGITAVGTIRNIGIVVIAIGIIIGVGIAAVIAYDVRLRHFALFDVFEVVGDGSCVISCGRVG